MLTTTDLKSDIKYIQENIKRKGNGWEHIHNHDDQVIMEQYKILNNEFINMEYQLKNLTSYNYLGETSETILIALQELIILCDLLKISPERLYKQVENTDYIFWVKSYSSLAELGLNLKGYINKQNEKKNIERVLIECMTWIAYNTAYLNHQIEEENKNEKPAPY